MINRFDLLLDLLEIEERHSFLAIGDVISKNKEKDLVIHHRL